MEVTSPGQKNNFIMKIFTFYELKNKSGLFSI